MNVAFLFQEAMHQRTFGMYFRRRLDRLLDEGLHVLLRRTGDASQTNPSDAFGFEHFRGHRHPQLARFSLTAQAFAHERMLPIAEKGSPGTPQAVQANPVGRRSRSRYRAHAISSPNQSRNWLQVAG